MKIRHILIKTILAVFVIFSIMAIVGYGYGGYGGNGGSSSSSDGGSRGITTSNVDPYSNIIKYEVVHRDLITNQSVEYPFTTPEFSIYQILTYGKENEYNIPIRIEDLKNTSKYAKAAPGIVYKNENVWLGSSRIKYISIRFRVENSWLKNNSIDDGRMPYLLKWNGTTWLILKTNITGKDDIYTYLESPKAGNSRIGIFAISTPIKRTNGTVKNVVTISEDEDVIIPEIEETEIRHKNIPGFDVVTVIISIILSATYMTRKGIKR